MHIESFLLQQLRSAFLSCTSNKASSSIYNGSIQGHYPYFCRS